MKHLPDADSSMLNGMFKAAAAFLEERRKLQFFCRVSTYHNGQSKSAEKKCGHPFPGARIGTAQITTARAGN